MDADFWHGKWQRNEIAFHEGRPNDLLVRYFHRLSLKAGSHVLVPLCGKTADIPWLMAQGLRVSGAELNRMAVEQLFAGLAMTPTVTPGGPLTCYSAPGIDIHLGDVFALSAEALGPVDAVYDRAALVALPRPVRARYARHLDEVTGAAPQLLISLEYDPASMAGPPFPVVEEEIRALYGARHCVTRLERRDIAGGFKTAREASESIWLLERGGA